MNRRKSRFIHIVAALTVILVLAYAFATVLPHSHSCIDPDCAICDVIKSSRDTLLMLITSLSLLSFPDFCLYAALSYTELFSLREGTPTGLKVKLSN